MPGRGVPDDETEAVLDERDTDAVLRERGVVLERRQESDERLRYIKDN